MCNDQSYRIVYMAKIVMLTTAFALLILVTNHMHVVFVTDNNKSDHDSILQNVFAQALQSKQKPSTSLVSEAIAPVLLAPIATSGNNVYLIWSSNKTGNYEIMFRASSDHGQGFENKINLSNSASDSQNAEEQRPGIEYLLHGGKVIRQVTNLYLGLAATMERTLAQLRVLL